MGHDSLSFPQEAVGHRNALIQKAARVIAQIEDQAFEVILIETLEILIDLRTGGLVERLDAHVSDAGLKPNGILNALPRNLIANHVKSQGLVIAFAGDDDLDMSATG